MRTIRWFFLCSLLSVAAAACGDDDGSGGAGGGAGGGIGGGIGGGAGGGTGGGAGADASVDGGDAGIDSDAMVSDAGTTTELHGVVRDEAMAPVASAKLLVYPVVGGVLVPDGVVAVTADADGTWSTGPIAPGTYHVRVDTSGGYWRTEDGAPTRTFSDFSEIATSGDWQIGGDVVGEATLVRLTRGDDTTFMRLADELVPPFTVEVTLRITQQTWESTRDGFRVTSNTDCGSGDVGDLLRGMEMQLYRALAAPGASVVEASVDCGGTGFDYQPTGLAQPSDWKTMRIEVGLGALIGESGTAAARVASAAAATAYTLDLPGGYDDGNGPDDTEDPTIMEVSGVRIYDYLFGETVDGPAGASVDVGTFEVAPPL